MITSGKTLTIDLQALDAGQPHWLNSGARAKRQREPNREPITAACEQQRIAASPQQLSLRLEKIEDQKAQDDPAKLAVRKPRALTSEQEAAEEARYRRDPRRR